MVNSDTSGCSPAVGRLLWEQEVGSSILPTPTISSVPAEFDAVNTLDDFVVNRKATRGLSARGEEWLRETLSKFLRWLPISLTDVTTATIIDFLGLYVDKPWRKHSFYRALRTFWKWLSVRLSMPNPFLDKFGNPVIEPPKVPSRILYTLNPEKVAVLIEAAELIRDKAIIALLADTGGRLSEIAGGRRKDTPGAQSADLDLERKQLKVLGKGNKQGYLVFGETTRSLLKRYLEKAKPVGKLFDLSYEGMTSMLRRLEDKSGVKCNAHSFRRGFATELRKKGLSELDIAELGRWSSTAMVKRYSRAYTFDDAAERYKPIVT